MLQAQSSAGRRPVRHSHAVEPWALKICCDRRPIGRVVAPLLPAIAKTCCAPLCDVAPVGHQVQRQGEVTVTGRLTATRSLLVSTHCSASPRPSGLSSSHHQKRSPCAGDYLWALCKMGWFRAAGHAQSLRSRPYPPIDTDSYPSPHPACWAAECHSAVVLGRERNLWLRRCAALVCSPAERPRTPSLRS